MLLDNVSCPVSRLGYSSPRASQRRLARLSLARSGAPLTTEPYVYSDRRVLLCPRRRTAASTRRRRTFQVSCWVATSYTRPPRFMHRLRPRVLGIAPGVPLLQIPLRYYRITGVAARGNADLRRVLVAMSHNFCEHSRRDEGPLSRANNTNRLFAAPTLISTFTPSLRHAMGGPSGAEVPAAHTALRRLTPTALSATGLEPARVPA